MTGSETHDLEPDAPTEEVALPAEEVEQEAPGAHEVPWRMLHPLSLVVNLVPRAWAMVRSLWPLLVLAVLGGRTGADTYVDLGIFAVFTAIAVSNTVVHFLTLRYRLAGDRLEIRTGLLHRNIRVISPRRVQNVELVRNLFHRLSGLVEVRIETASGDEVEGMLSALTEQDARALMTALTAARGRVRAEEGAPEAPALITNDLTDIVKLGATGTRWGAAAITIGFLFEVISSNDPERSAELTLALGLAGAAGLFLVALAGAWLLGITNAVVRHHGFSLRQEDDALVATEGLLTRRRVELPIRKVQVAAVHAPWLRRLAGFSSVVIETASARAGSGGTQRALTMVPVVPAEDVDRIVRIALPRADAALDAPLQPADPRALRRGLIRGTIKGLLAAAAFTWWYGPWGALSLLAAPIPAILEWLDWRHQGWLVTDEVVVSRRGYLRRVTTVVARDKLQSVEVEQGPLMRRWGLGEVQLRVAGTGVAMPLLDHAAAFTLAARLSAAAAGAGPTAPTGLPAPAPTPAPAAFPS